MSMLRSKGGILHYSAFVPLVLTPSWLIFPDLLDSLEGFFFFVSCFCSTFGYPDRVPAVMQNVKADWCSADYNPAHLPGRLSRCVAGQRGSVSRSHCHQMPMSSGTSPRLFFFFFLASRIGAYVKPCVFLMVYLC